MVQRFFVPKRCQGTALQGDIRNQSLKIRAFVELITDYNLPGMLNVTREGRTNGDPTFDWWYDREMGFGGWKPDLIPFISMGNGDFFCLSASQGPQSGVYYVYHEDGQEEQLTVSFQEWIERMDEFL